MRQIVPGDATHAVQRSIELSVALEAAQKEIAEKNALILKAQQSIDDIAHNYEDKLRAAQDSAKRAQAETSNIQRKYVELEQRLTEALQAKDRESTRGDELVARVTELESRLRTYAGAEDERDRGAQRLRATEAECSRLRAELEEKEKVSRWMHRCCFQFLAMQTKCRSRAQYHYQMYLPNTCTTAASSS